MNNINFAPDLKTNQNENRVFIIRSDVVYT